MKNLIKNILYRLYKNYKRGRHGNIYMRFQNHTMIGERTFNANLDIVKKTLEIPGCIVECGTWKGGMISAIATIYGNSRNFYLFDSFEGLPQAEQIDGESALNYQREINSPRYYNNCKASEEDVVEAMNIAGITSYSIIKGWFNKTLEKTDLKENIAVLRMDADWYESTYQILKYLFPKVIIGGVIIIDDYYVWDGCSKAIHDYLSLNKRSERIREHNGVCYIIKKNH